VRAEPHTVCVAGSAGSVRGRVHQVASDLTEILVASSAGSAASITSPARHASIGPDLLRPVDPARQPRRLTDRQLTPAT
jgi:hypothetical protein